MSADGACSFHFFRPNFPNDFTRYAHDHGMRPDAPLLRHHRAGGDQAFLADLAVGQQPRPDADERLAADSSAMQDGPVSDHDAFFNILGDVVIGMNDATVLNIDPRPQGDPG